MAINTVNNNVNNHILTSTRARRAAAVLCAALAGLGLARGAAAQLPQAGSPATPTPYQSPLFHSGGSDPATPQASPPFGLADLDPANPLLLNPLYGNLQGTPTALVPGTGTNLIPVQIPSFDLGAYNPILGPGQNGTTGYYPDHLADGGVFSWQAPFNYVPLVTGMVVVDDNAAAPMPPSGTTPGTSGFALTGGWVLEPPAGGTSPAAGTATGGEYQRLPPNTNGTATWTLVATVAGSYSVYFHIPDQIEDSTGAVETRSTQVTYQIATTGANAVTSTATVSQTEANSSQFLAGPFVLAIGDTVTVTLQRDNTHNQNTEAVVTPATTGAYLIADSMTLQTAIGDVRSSPTAINASAYPADFKNVKYWGIFVPAGTTNPVPASTAAGANNAPPDSSDGTATGTPIYRYGDNTKSDPVHLVRQLVYFGRQDPTFSNGSTVDDNAPAPTATVSGFTTSGFNPISDSTGTATNNEYRTASPVTAGAGSTATWTFIAPNGGDYYATVHLPETQGTQKRITDAQYRITVNGTPLTTQPAAGFQISQAQTGDVTLPTGALRLNKGDRVAVTLTAVTGLSNPTTYTVVADSVRIATGGTGAIYCVDGFTGGVVWRFATPGGLNGPGAAVFSSPVVTKINVLVTPAGPGGTPAAVYQNKLVVIVGDENGMVYCLDAVGNGDGTSNSQAIDPTSGLPIYIPQPAYGATPPTQVDQAGYRDANGFGHVGTTRTYWIYRPDPNQPKYVTGGNIGKVKPASQFDVNSDLPVPAAFGTASPNVFVDPNVSRVADATTGSIPLNPDGSAPSNAKVYVGNSNGVLYALDGIGVPIDGTSAATYAATGDRFNASYDLRVAPGVFPAVATDGIVPTPQPLWWFSLRGADPNSTTNPSNADIESAPAIHATVTTTSVTDTNGNVTTTSAYAPTVYIGSAHEVEATSNVGRLYALDGTYGPAGSNGQTFPATQTDPTAPNYSGPGSVNYNVGQRPQISATDVADWSFPDAYDRTGNNPTKNNQGQSSNKLPRPALGNVTGSPVVFTDTNETDPARRTRVYFAANVGLEVPTGSTVGTAASARPDETETGRIWAVNLDGSVGRTTNSSGTSGAVWAYPLANDPNNAALDKTAEPSAPLGAFLRATPAMGFIQFPATIQNGDGGTYTPTDVIHTGGNGLKGQSVPMLYVATRGVNDTALYAVDVDGANDTQRLIYRQISPDGSIFQSSPVLIANTSVPPVGLTSSGGNGGAVYVVSDNTLYDFSATPISNPITTEAYPLIRENKAYTGFGPISSPAVAAADTYDLLQQPAVPAGYPYNTNATDWIYVGDSSTGFCRGITPFDTTDLGIPGELGAIVPPTADSPGAVDLQAIMQVYLVDSTHSNSTNASDALPLPGDLPVYDWGQDVYIRFKNVAPPADSDGVARKFVTDPNATPTGGPVQYYGNGGPIEFDLSDSTDGTPPDHGTVPAIFLPAANTPLGNGFIARGDADPAPSATVPNSLIDPTTNKGYIGAYTYAISDGTARRNTPGSRRQVLNAKQTVHVYETTNGTTFTDTGRTAVLQVQTTNGNLISAPIVGAGGVITGYRNNLTIVPPVDQPTFGILNPLAVRGGGIPLPLNPSLGGTPKNAVDVGDAVGPFRGIVSPIMAGATTDLEALTNGNAILVTPPKSTGGGGGTILTDPTKRNILATNPATTTHVVVTSTGLISHNTTGENADAPPSGPRLPLFPPIGSGSNSTTGEGLTATQATDPLTFGSQIAPYAMDMADRSALGPRQKRLRVKTGTISGGGAGLYWNDNSVPTLGHDHDSVVNFLPWESAPVGYKVGANPSIDYPDIGPSDITATMFRYSGGTADLTLGNAIAEPAQVPSGSTNSVTSRVVKTNPIRFQISIPHFQPANQQVYQKPANGQGYGSGFETAPVDVNGSPLINNPLVFPMGYVTTRRIYIPDQGGFYRPGAAYRDVRVYTGVPPDYSTEMADATVAVPHTVPSGFGVQTSRYAPLNLTGPPLDPTSPLGTFDMFNPAFVSAQTNVTTDDYFQPLTIHNTGNVNLLNVHLDQKRNKNGALQARPLVSDAVDAASFIPAYDYNASLTGQRSGLFVGVGGNEPEDSYLLRSSLDGDLVAAYGHNPAIVNNTNGVAGIPLIQIYPGATFHKAQVGSGQPSTLTVPDSPEGFTPGASLDVSANLKPAVPNYSTGQVYKSPPFVSVAVPFGTPVGSYHTTFQLFEGLDGSGYDPGGVVASGAYPPGVPQGDFAGLVTQIFPPRYGNATGGIGVPAAPGNTPNNRPQDTIQIVSATNGDLSLMPTSKNGTVLNVTVGEDRMTDGATFGATAMVDQGPAIPATTGANATPARAVPDFAPAGFRDPTSGNLSVYWTSGRSGSTYGIYSATVPFLGSAFMPVDPTTPGSTTAPGYVPQWWTSLGSESNGYLAGGTLNPAIPTSQGTNSGLTIVQQATLFGANQDPLYAFAVNVQTPPLPGVTAYQNTLLCYTVDPRTGVLGSPAQPVTNDPSQVKYGVKGLSCRSAGYARSLWAFWTATARGRTAIYYNSADPNTGAWVPTSGSNTPATQGLLPVPAGLTAVADAAPLLMYGNIPGSTALLNPVIEVTYSGTAADGNVDLYDSRYQPDSVKPAVLDLVPFPAVTEILKATGQPGGWYQARDVAWSRTGALNLFVNGAPILYDTTNNNSPRFSRAVFDKATGLLVLTGVQNRTVNGANTLAFANTPATGTVTVYIDLATGRARFSATPNATVTAFFSPLARRITDDARADTGPTTFLDRAQSSTNGSPTTDRRWYVWRKSGTGGAAPSATIYYKTQRLTAFLGYPVDASKPISITINGTGYTPAVDVYNVPAVLNADGSVKYPASGRLYFPIQSGSQVCPEGQTYTVSYTDTNGTGRTWPVAPATDTVQWQDEIRSNDTAVPPTDATAGLFTVLPGYLVPLDNPVNENNVSAFLDPFAGLNNPHKVWLFWNSTRNGTADVYFEAINPLFGAGP